MADRNGIVTALILGVGFLVVTTIVILLVLGTITDSNLLRGNADSLTDRHTSANATCCVLDGWNAGYKDFSIIQVLRANTTIVYPAANYTLNTNTGLLTNATNSAGMDDVNVTYQFFIPSNSEMTVDSASGNLSTGIGNVSNKIPTILLIAAVVLLFGVIVLLVRQSQQMGMSSFSTGSSSGGSL
jgi:hypothetical protein